MPDQRSRSTGALRSLASAGLGLLHRATGSARPDALAPTRRAWEVEKLLAAGSPEAVLLDTRRGVALIVAYRALAAAADRRAIASERLSDQAESAYRRSVVRGR